MLDFETWEGEFDLLAPDGENLTSENFGTRKAVSVDAGSFSVLDLAVMARDELPSLEPHAASNAADREIMSHPTKEVASFLGLFFIIIFNRKCRQGCFCI
jgi:hypothetical protein